jgi:phosphotriesterase-related protein
VHTVRGPVSPEELGWTDIHEHVLCDLGRNAEADPAHPELLGARVTLESAGILSHNPLAMADNLVLSDEALAAAELAACRDAGIGAIVDPTTRHFGRDPAALRRIAEATGLHIVAATGRYVHGFLSPAEQARPVEELVEEMLREVTEGIDGSGVRAGIIGELGTSECIHADEARTLVAAARVSRRTGAPLMVHTDPHSRMALQALAVLERAGADPCRVSICHVDSSFLEEEYLEAILERGAFVELDTFGENFCLHPNYGPSDLDRIRLLCRLLDAGHARQVMLGCDLCMKSRLHAFGGWGYDHLPTNVLPAMRRLGIAASDLETLLRDNPARYLAF